MRFKLQDISTQGNRELLFYHLVYGNYCSIIEACRLVEKDTKFFSTIITFVKVIKVYMYFPKAAQAVPFKLQVIEKRYDRLRHYKLEHLNLVLYPMAKLYIQQKDYHPVRKTLQ